MMRKIEVNDAFKLGQRVRHRSTGLIGAVVNVDRYKGNIINENVTYTVQWDIAGREPDVGENELEAVPNGDSC